MKLVGLELLQYFRWANVWWLVTAVKFRLDGQSGAPTNEKWRKGGHFVLPQGKSVHFHVLPLKQQEFPHRWLHLYLTSLLIWCTGRLTQSTSKRGAQRSANQPQSSTIQLSYHGSIILFSQHTVSRPLCRIKCRTSYKDDLYSSTSLVFVALFVCELSYSLVSKHNMRSSTNALESSSHIGLPHCFLLKERRLTFYCRFTADCQQTA